MLPIKSIIQTVRGSIFGYCKCDELPDYGHEYPTNLSLKEGEWSILMEIIMERLREEIRTGKLTLPVVAGDKDIDGKNRKQTVDHAEDVPLAQQATHMVFTEKEERKEEKSGKQRKNSSGLQRALSDFLQKTYLFRYNLLTAETECASQPCGFPSETNTEPAHRRYVTVEQRVLNGICLSAQTAGIDCWDRDVTRYVYSDKIPEYHPFIHYFDTLPAWDGKDRVTPMARRVSDNPVWTAGFHRWMLALTAQWMGRNEGERANSVAPLLISPEQGWGKSTFCRLLMPAELKRYFTESFDLSAPTAAERKLADFGLINLDEFDKLPVSKMPLLKNLMQISALNIRKTHMRNISQLYRIASFIGTSNHRDLLTDLTGSRRFLCVEPYHPIDCTTPVDHEQLYAQLKEELIGGERYWFSSEEENEITENNRKFYKSTPEEEVFHQCFRFADREETGSEILTAAEIFKIMQKSNPAALRGSNCYTFSRMLPTIGKKIHTKYCNGYCVIKR